MGVSSVSVGRCAWALSGAHQVLSSPYSCCFFFLEIKSPVLGPLQSCVCVYVCVVVLCTLCHRTHKTNKMCLGPCWSSPGLVVVIWARTELTKKSCHPCDKFNVMGTCVSVLNVGRHAHPGLKKDL